MRDGIATVSDGGLEVAVLLAVSLYLGITEAVQVVVARVGGVLGVGGFDHSNVRGRGEPRREGAEFEASVLEKIGRHGERDCDYRENRRQREKNLKPGRLATLYCLIEGISETRPRKRLLNRRSSAGPDP